MKILALNGSPTKKKGMTNILMELFLQGAKEAGADVKSVLLSEKKINFCTGCFKCWIKHPGKCIFKDDMPELLEEISQSDVVLFCTPVYADGMTAQMKCCIDRIIPLIKPEIENVDGHYRHVKRMNKIPKIGLLSVCGFYELDNFDPLISHVKSICKNFQAEYVGAILRPTSYTLAMEEFYPEEFVTIKNAIIKAGSELVKDGKFNSKTLEEIAFQPITHEESLERGNLMWEVCHSKGEFLFHNK